MSRLILLNTILVLLTGALVVVIAAPPAIGTVSANGTVLLDHARVRGNTTLFDGALLETYGTPSLVRLEGGAEMRLGSASRSRLYKDRLVLESGEMQVSSTNSYRFEAGSFRVYPETTGAKSYVAVRSTGHVTVSALVGTVKVATAEGTLLAKLDPGYVLEFETQAAGAAPPFSLAGCVSVRDNRTLLTDRITGVSFELRGQGLDQLAGQYVQVVGTELKGVQPGPGASQVIQVSSAKRAAGSCAVQAAGSNPAGGSGTKKAVIAGVAIAAAAGGVTLGLTADEPADSTISR